MRRRYGLVLAGLLLAGCGSTAVPAGSVSAPPVASSAPAAASVASTPPVVVSAATAAATSAAGAVGEVDLAALATRFGCDGYTVQPAAPLTTTYATCTLAGSRVQLYGFASADMAGAFLDSVKGFGVTADQMAVGDGYLIAPTDPARLAAIRAALQ